MMGHRETLKGGDEVDAFSKYRRILIWRAGDRANIKTRFNRRQRRQTRIAIATELSEVSA